MRQGKRSLIVDATARSAGYAMRDRHAEDRDGRPRGHCNDAVDPGRIDRRDIGACTHQVSRRRRRREIQIPAVVAVDVDDRQRHRVGAFRKLHHRAGAVGAIRLHHRRAQRAGAGCGVADAVGDIVVDEVIGAVDREGLCREGSQRASTLR